MNHITHWHIFAVLSENEDGLLAGALTEYLCAAPLFSGLKQ